MTLRCVKDGDLLYNNSKDDFPLNTVEGILFNTYTTDSIHNPQKPVTTRLFVLSNRLQFWKNWQKRRTPRRNVMGTTDRRGCLVPKHIEILKFGCWNRLSELCDGPSQVRRTVVSPRFKTLQLLRIWYRERFSERHDGSAGRTITGVTDRHRLFSGNWVSDPCDDLQDGPSQARRAVAGCAIPVWVGFLDTF